MAVVSEQPGNHPQAGRYEVDQNEVVEVCYNDYTIWQRELGGDAEVRYAADIDLYRVAAELHRISHEVLDQARLSDIADGKEPRL